MTDDDLATYLEDLLEDLPPDATISFRFYQQGDEYIVETKTTFTEERVKYTIEQKLILTFAGDRPGSIALNVLFSEGGRKFYENLSYVYTYNDNLPSYPGPFMLD